jgi:hypothetical protein
VSPWVTRLHGRQGWVGVDYPGSGLGVGLFHSSVFIDDLFINYDDDEDEGGYCNKPTTTHIDKSCDAVDKARLTAETALAVAVQERNAANAERDAANAERDAANAERDAAMAKLAVAQEHADDRLTYCQGHYGFNGDEDDHQDPCLVWRCDGCNCRDLSDAYDEGDDASKNGGEASVVIIIPIVVAVVLLLFAVLYLVRKRRVSGLQLHRQSSMPTIGGTEAETEEA